MSESEEPRGLIGMVNDLKKLLDIRDTHVREGNMAGLLDVDATIMRLDEEIVKTFFVDVTAVGRALADVRKDARSHIERNQKRIDGPCNDYSDPIEEKKRQIKGEFNPRPGPIIRHPDRNIDPGLLR